MALLTTYNGWLQALPTQLARVHVGSRSAQVRAGDVATVLGAFLADFAREVEPITTLYGWRSIADNDRAGGDERSTHLSGTALDINGRVHPWEKRTGTARYPDRGGFTTKQLAALRKVLARYGGVIAWGGDYPRGIRDAMHYDIRASAAAVAALAARIRGTTGGDDDMALTEDDANLVVGKLLNYRNPATRPSVYSLLITAATAPAQVSNLIGAVKAMAQGEDFDEAKLLAGVEASAAEGAQKGTAAALVALEDVIRDVAGVNADEILAALKAAL